MVRLWVTGIKTNPSDPTKFQFQNGTIMSVCLFLTDEPWFYISIPKWYDYEKGKQRRLWTRDGISIPKWYDYELGNRKWFGWLLFISIPKWYDYERTSLIDSSSACLNFNSKMVRLWASMAVPNGWFCCIFQFQNGTIMRDCNIS